jgi:DNA-binding winged helix-turn-helix (wHTH) protein/tetratricopeptide (TPR) repeat protein
MGPGTQSPFTGFRLGALTIDLDQGRVIGPEGPSGLTPRAEDLLLLFARRANTVVVREDILDTVWAGRVVEDAAITHCVWQIRKALGAEGKEILQTRAKRGYVLAVPDGAWIRNLPVASPAATIDPLPVSAPDEAPPADGVDGVESTATAAMPQRQISAPKSRRFGWRAGAIAALAILAMIAAWRLLSASDGIELDPRIEMSATVLTPPSLEWLRETLLRKTIEQAHVRDVEVVVFQRAQTRNPFRGAHLQVRIERLEAQTLDAELTLTQGRARIRERYRGMPDGLPNALQTLLTQHLPAPGRRLGATTDAYVAGRLAEVRFDRATAVQKYRHALALDPRMTDARIALAGLLFEQGRADEARKAALPLVPAAETDPVHRCRIERLLARVAPDRLSADACPRAGVVARVTRLQLRDALREIERLHAQPAGAGEWLEQEDALIQALLRLQELERAKYEIGRARAIAERAGWPYAAHRLETNLASMHMHRGERPEAAAVQTRIAEAFAGIGDISSATESRMWVQRAEPIVPGPTVAGRRAHLQKIIEQASAVGNLKVEIEALLLLARYDRDHPAIWHKHLDRARLRMRDAGLDGGNSLHPYFAVAEVVGARHYREALAELQTLQRVPHPHPRALTWILPLQAESHFWRDEIGAAVAAVDAMERAGLESTSSPNPCLLAWVLTEAGQRDRANAYLEHCNSGDRSPVQTDYGLVAMARQRVLDGTPAEAWPLLRPRIDALLAIRTPNRHEAESLALLTLQTVRMPDADPERLKAARRAVERVAALDGAGPGLRLGAELLRAAQCQPAVVGDCPGPGLPGWAPEDRLAARIVGRPPAQP